MAFDATSHFHNRIVDAGGFERRIKCAIRKSTQRPGVPSIIAKQRAAAAAASDAVDDGLNLRGHGDGTAFSGCGLRAADQTVLRAVVVLHVQRKKFARPEAQVDHAVHIVCIWHDTDGLPDLFNLDVRERRTVRGSFAFDGQKLRQIQVLRDQVARDVPVMRLKCKGIGSGFAPEDYVKISYVDTSTDFGLLGGDNLADGTYREVLAAGDDYLVLDAYAPKVTVRYYIDEAPPGVYVKAAMDTPDMDYVIEAQNRLWGCKYGTVNGKLVNEIYASALGRFDVWHKYAGVSTDSYAASVGSDGRWTGAVNYQGYPLFFKEDRMHKVYVSASGAHRIQEYTMRGVQPGGAKSLAVVNGVLFYKARDCVCAYDGSGAPTDVSEKLNLNSLSRPGSTTSIAAAYRDKYYLYLQMNTPPGSRLLVLDTRRGTWYRENLPIGSITDFTEHLGSLLCAAGGIEEIAHDNQGSELIGTEEGNVAWSCETGLIGYSTVEQKYVSRFNIRMSLARDAYMDVLVQYDSDGVWHNQGRIQGVGTRTFMLPVRPRRCDHFRIRLEGSGDVRIYSFAKIFEAGSDVYADI